MQCERILFSFPSHGDNVAPVLILFAIQAALDYMAMSWSFEQPNFEWCPKAEDDVRNTPDGYLTRRIEKKSRVENFNVFRSLLADEGSFFFLSREDLIAGTIHTTK